MCLSYFASKGSKCKNLPCAALLYPTLPHSTFLTLLSPQAATSAKREVRRQDSAISAVAVDALLNAEAVMLYSAERQLAAQYDTHLAGDAHPTQRARDTLPPRYVRRAPRRGRSEGLER